MKKSQSLFLALLCLPLTFTSFSQTESQKDDDGLCSRWFNVTNSEDNASLFAALPEFFKEIKRQNDHDTLYVMLKSVEMSPLVDQNGDVITKTINGESSFVYQNQTAKRVQSDVPLVDENGNPMVITLEDGTQSFVFPEPVITCLHKDVPLSDENGQHIVQELENGKLSFVYSNPVDFTIQPQAHAIGEDGKLYPWPDGPSQSYSLSEHSISELRIIETRTHYDYKTGEYSDDFHVSRIGICINVSPTEQEQIWIDLLNFFDNMENPEENAFYQLLSERAFEGLRYKETVCK